MDDSAAPSVSVVIITAGRRQCLPACIASLRRQTYRPVELVVVVGPSKDGTTEYVRSLSDAKVVHVNRLNVAHARNAGIRECGGELIAFIDDDAVAGPTWLAEIASVFQREGPDCGGVGGWVVNENDRVRSVQARNPVIDEFGVPQPVRLSPGSFNDPAGRRFNFLMGCNMVFRRQAILDAGGCDDLYTYNYEDADLCVGVIHAGYRIVHHVRAVVHHYPAASHNRRSEYDLNYYAISRHQTYFSLKFSRRSARACLAGVLRDKRRWIQFLWSVRREMGVLNVPRYAARGLLGVAAGFYRGLAYRSRPVQRALPADLPRPRFSPMGFASPPTVPAEPTSPKALSVALLCGEFGGRAFGGVGAYTEHLAESLAALGHEVFVLRANWSPCRIRSGRYRIVDVAPEYHPAHQRASYVRTLLGIEANRPIDVVEAPLWQGEGIGVGASMRWPLVVRLETPFGLVHQIAGKSLDAGSVVGIAAERLELGYAQGVIAISQAVARTVEETYDLSLDVPGRRLAVIPLGLPSAGQVERRPVPLPASRGARFLFVGRLEARKGIAELGEAFGRLIDQGIDASLWIVGADNSRHDGFWERNAVDYPTHLVRGWSSEARLRAAFFGSLSEPEKNFLYESADVLVAPSRYESFGIIFLEAMRFAKPVIGTRAGGVPEIVAEDETGLLVAPGDVAGLAEAMKRLAGSAGLRRELGEAGQRRFHDRFDLSRLGVQTERFYREVLRDWRGGRRNPAAAAALETPPERTRPSRLPAWASRG